MFMDVGNVAESSDALISFTSMDVTVRRKNTVQCNIVIPYNDYIAQAAAAAFGFSLTRLFFWRSLQVRPGFT